MKDETPEQAISRLVLVAAELLHEYKTMVDNHEATKSKAGWSDVSWLAHLTESLRDGAWWRDNE